MNLCHFGIKLQNTQLWEKYTRKYFPNTLEENIDLVVSFCNLMGWQISQRTICIKKYLNSKFYIISPFFF